MHALYDVPAPAKLNLFLHILGRRSDGYHLIESVFTLIDWCDTLHFHKVQTSEISREDLGTPLPTEDLCLKAAKALQRATGHPQGVHISIQKDVPSQAGMGGGSSDAASTLLALNQLWNLNLNRSQLEKIGLTLGADVPFFLRGRTSWVTGIGEIIQSLDDCELPPECSLVVVKPERGLDTKSIFSHPDLKRDATSATIAGFVAAHYDYGRNDLQAVAEMLCADVKTAKTWLESQGLKARMTGSGSAVFARKLHDIDTSSAPPDWIVKNCKSLNIHPLQGWVSEND